MTNSKKRRLIIFTRRPRFGTCKTRLIPFLGPANAAELHKRLTARMIEEANQYCDRDADCELEIRYIGGSAAQMRTMFGEFHFREQAEGDLGMKMSQAVNQAVSEKCEAALVIGCDCIDHTAEIIDKAFSELAKNDLVLGPAYDGGYYAIGLKRPVDQLFPPNMPWGTKTVMKKTLAIARKLKLKFSLLKRLHDLDRPEDLARVYNHPIMENLPEPVVSIVIPTLNEAPHIKNTIQSAKAPLVEIIVVDGGSDDSTRESAESLGAKVVRSERGKGVQQNFGADISKGKILLFLHADTLLPKGFLFHVIKTISQPKTAAGAFKLEISGDNRALKIIQFFSNLRSRLFQLPYGDQGLFMRRETFEKTGAFPRIPIMEDFALVKSLQKLGKVAISQASVRTSGRRWQKKGCLKTFLINQAMVIGYVFKIKAETLEKWYGR